MSKFRSSEEIQAAINVGLVLFGENRVHEAVEIFPSILEKNPQLKLQMIGSLQRNKVKHLLPIATCIQSVDRIELIKEIIKEVKKRNEVSASNVPPIELLFEIHTAEDSKNGLKTSMNFGFV